MPKNDFPSDSELIVPVFIPGGKFYRRSLDDVSSIKFNYEENSKTLTLMNGLEQTDSNK